MRRNILLCWAALLFLSTQAYSQTVSDDTIRNEFLGIEIQKPESWFQGAPGDQSSKDRLLLASQDPIEDQAILAISRLPGLGRTLESFATTTRNYVFTNMQGFIDSEAHLTLDGAPSYLMIYQGNSGVAENGWRNFYRVITEKDGDFIIFQGITNQEDFARHKGTLEAMIKSTSWITPEPETSQDGK